VLLELVCGNPDSVGWVWWSKNSAVPLGDLLITRKLMMNRRKKDSKTTATSIHVTSIIRFESNVLRISVEYRV